jgi:23S rRNA (cytosine1962-C5)-methyltransferase
LILRIVSVRKGREWQVLRGHPWLFSGSISQPPANATPGEIVDLVDCNGKFIARGYYNPGCDIAVRVLTMDPAEGIDEKFVERRVHSAIELRRQLFDPKVTNMYRLINAEGDFLPGIIVDLFGDVVVVQSHTAGADRLTDYLITALINELNPKCIIVRNDSSVRRREGLSLEPPHIVHDQNTVASGDSLITCKENGFEFKVDPLKGQKTGFFTDQRDKRVVVGRYCRMLAENSTMANCFSYSAAFSVYAAALNDTLKTINIDESNDALELARANFTLNNSNADRHEFLQEDVFSYLTRINNEGRKFEFVILDPPAFAKKQKDLKNALKAYTKLNRLGLACCAPGGFLLTCSCSGMVTMDDLENCVQFAAADAGRRVQILEIFKHGADHPVNLSLPETAYLKVILCRVI